MQFNISTWADLSFSFFQKHVYKQDARLKPCAMSNQKMLAHCKIQMCLGFLSTFIFLVFVTSTCIYNENKQHQ